jgi:hypothetical protein
MIESWTRGAACRNQIANSVPRIATAPRSKARRRRPVIQGVDRNHEFGTLCRPERGSDLQVDGEKLARCHFRRTGVKARKDVLNKRIPDVAL